ncbi:Fic family protein [Kosakonia sp. BYX6]|uniref:Fic family protein n=1 Tax=Kosakonia calanthes TaxID=3139408 RepID=A0ABZ3B5C6_9ENTR
MPVKDNILDAVRMKDKPVSSSELAQALNVGKSTIKRHVDVLVREGSLLRQGIGKATRYSSVTAVAIPDESVEISDAQALLTYLQSPLTTREITGYVREFVDSYIPNKTFLLPEDLAQTLLNEGRMAGQQPAGTYARKVLEPLLVDLSWSSSRLEGNTYSLLATEELFRSGMDAEDLDAVMLLNHKQAIEFLVDAVPQYGLTAAVISNLHSILMRDLLSDSTGLGSIRTKIVNISGTTYTPLQTPVLLQDMFETIIEKARKIKNPVESAFFLWVNLAYLQPFEDGNKRTSRLAANIPLMMYNSAPLSFLDAEPTGYAYAMMGIYEKQDASLAAELFEFLYRRSIKKYAVTLEAMGVPDPFRYRHRETLNEVICHIVRERISIEAAMTSITLDENEKNQFRTLLQEELRILEVYNCARYHLSMGLVKKWIEDGRPQ